MKNKNGQESVPIRCVAFFVTKTRAGDNGSAIGYNGWFRP